MAKIIPLTQGREAIIDDQDYDKVSPFKWHAAMRKGIWYARTYMPGNRKTAIKMHRFILGLSSADHIQVDHVDGNGLNNTRANLRIATNSQNGMNRRKCSGYTSIYKGVSWLKIKRRWLAQIMLNKKNIRLGSFIDEKDAARAYNEAALKFFGQYARLNIIK